MMQQIQIKDDDFSNTICYGLRQAEGLTKYCIMLHPSFLDTELSYFCLFCHRYLISRIKQALQSRCVEARAPFLLKVPILLRPIGNVPKFFILLFAIYFGLILFAKTR